ncbi:MAG: SagB/ThcOx family dehydrogenase, partial [Candidatus Coatesbacteria bacterium]|nr:SagB/ThcOx family dehydrogenase [Candidatus Coatesbacteria bacterium]
MSMRVFCATMVIFLLVQFTSLIGAENVNKQGNAKMTSSQVGPAINKVKLPAPKLKGTMSVEEAIKLRRTVRSFAEKPLTLEMVSQLLWAAQGITDDERHIKRAAPSAGATYPIDMFVACGKSGISGLGAGVWRYTPSDNTLERLVSENQMSDLAECSLRQTWAAEAPIILAIACEYSR